MPKQFLNEEGDYNCVKAIIDWTLDFEIRYNGIKDVYINIIKVRLIFDDDRAKSYIIDDDTGFEFNSCWSWDKWLTIYPVAILVDLDDKKVEVEF